jgi:hypothetical protein
MPGERARRTGPWTTTPISSSGGRSRGHRGADMVACLHSPRRSSASCASAYQVRRDTTEPPLCCIRLDRRSGRALAVAGEWPWWQPADKRVSVGRLGGRRPGGLGVDDLGGGMRLAKLVPLAAVGLLSACSAGAAPMQLAPRGQPSVVAAAGAVPLPPAAECPDEAPAAFGAPQQDHNLPAADLLSPSTSSLLLCVYDRSITGPAGSTTTTFTFHSGVEVSQAVVDSTVKSINDLPSLYESDEPIYCNLAGRPLITLIASNPDGLQQQLQVDTACGVMMDQDGLAKRGIGPLGALVY